MFDLISKTFKSLRHKGIWKYVLLSLLVATGAFYAIYEVISVVLDDTKVFESGWAEWLFDFIIKAGTLILTWIFFPVALLGIISIFEEKIAVIIEREEYQPLANPTPLSLMQEIKLIIRNLLWNLLFLPLFLIPLLGTVIYYALNSYLVGNTIFRFIAARSVGAEGASILAQKNNSKVVMAGLVIVALTSIPFLNVVAPIFAIILMVHQVAVITQKDNL